MKKGSADDPFAEEPEEETEEKPGSGGDDVDEVVQLDSETQQAGHVSSQHSSQTESNTRSSGQVSASQSPSEQRSLPYIYSRDSVKDGRQQRPIFLRDEVEDGIPTLVGDLEDVFGENVYRTDVLEAAVEIAQENPELVEGKLEQWGYGWQ